MERYESNVKMTGYWAVAITLSLVLCSLIWANVVISGNHDKVKIIEIQTKGAK